MAKTYALIVSGMVWEIIQPYLDNTDPDAPRDVPLNERYPADFVAQCVEIPDGATVADGMGGQRPVAPNDTFAGGVFGPPPAPPALTIDQVKAMRDGFLAEATLRINPLQDAVDLEEATAEEVALLKKWKQYRVALSRIELQAGFPAAVDWPVAP